MKLESQTPVGVQQMARAPGRRLPVAVHPQPVGALDGGPADAQPGALAVVGVTHGQAGEADAGPGVRLLKPVVGLQEPAAEILRLFVGWQWARADAIATLSNEGALKNRRFITLFLALVKFVTPVLVFVVLLSGLGVIKL